VSGKIFEEEVNYRGAEEADGAPARAWALNSGGYKNTDYLILDQNLNSKSGGDGHLEIFSLDRRPWNRGGGEIRPKNWALKDSCH
jgi:hypothetical protein